MSKLNSKSTANPQRTTVVAASPIQTVRVSNAKTHEGGIGYTRDAKSELFPACVTGFWGENTFYEKAEDRNQRVVELMRAVAVEDPQWYSQFVRWLRGPGNIRTAAIAAAAQGADAQAKAGITGYIRGMIRVALQRADEPGEFLAYWFSNISRSPRSHAVQRAIGEACNTLYTEYSLLKYDTPSKGFRFGDVIALARPPRRTASITALFKYALDRRREPGTAVTEALPMVAENRAVLEMLRNNRDSVLAMPDVQDVLQRAGLTWEQLGGTGVMDARAWTTVIPQMGYMALLRNLRNFEQAGVSHTVLKQVARKLSDPDQVARSRQLPFRFLSAYKQVQNTVLIAALEDALQLSLKNIPELPGKTLVLVDASGSMGISVSDHSTMSRFEVGGLFGIALAAKNHGAILYGWADGPKMYEFPVAAGANVLRTSEQFRRTIGIDGYGTNITYAVSRAVAEHPDAARVVIVSDMQCMYGNVAAAAPVSMPMYAFDLAGYRATSMNSGENRHQLGGMTDATFGLIRSIEAGQAGDWSAIFE